MKRFHVHVSVDDLTKNIRFYSAMFGVAPTVEKADYAKWMLDDPRINFAISPRREAAAGVNHLELQQWSSPRSGAEGPARDRVASADIQARDEVGASCCYAKSDKYWVQDPQGIAWETFRTLGEIPVFGEHAPVTEPAQAACCVRETPVTFAPRPKKNACCG